MPIEPSESDGSLYRIRLLKVDALEYSWEETSHLRSRGPMPGDSHTALLSYRTAYTLKMRCTRDSEDRELIIH